MAKDVPHCSSHRPNRLQRLPRLLHRRAHHSPSLHPLPHQRRHAIPLHHPLPHRLRLRRPFRGTLIRILQPQPHLRRDVLAVLRMDRCRCPRTEYWRLAGVSLPAGRVWINAFTTAGGTLTCLCDHQMRGKIFPISHARRSWG
jgi:hypothetical protein